MKRFAFAPAPEPNPKHVWKPLDEREWKSKWLPETVGKSGEDNHNRYRSGSLPEVNLDTLLGKVEDDSKRFMDDDGNHYKTTYGGQLWVDFKNKNIAEREAREEVAKQKAAAEEAEKAKQLKAQALFEPKADRHGLYFLNSSVYTNVKVARYEMAKNVSVEYDAPDISSYTRSVARAFVAEYEKRNPLPPDVTEGTVSPQSEPDQVLVKEALKSSKCCCGKKSTPPRRPSRRLPEIPVVISVSPMAKTSAIPLATTNSLELKTRAMPEPHFAMLGLGALGTVLVCTGCFIQRCYSKVKKTVRRDSFGFLSDSLRNSLTDSERVV